MTLPVRFQLERRIGRRRRLLLARRLMPGGQVRVLGHGAFSTAFAVGRSKVLKVTDSRDETAMWFAHWVGRFPNPHWPRIYRQVRLGGSHVATWMERLHSLDRISRERVSCVDDFVIAAHHSSAAHLEELANFGFNGPWQGCPKRLRQPLLDCRAAAERRGFSPDAKREVFMRRPGGILVLADPFLVAGRGARPRPGRLVPAMATLG